MRSKFCRDFRGNITANNNVTPKMYSLRTRTSRQCTIEFPCRKRSREVLVKVPEANCPIAKRTRQRMPITRSSSRAKGGLSPPQPSLSNKENRAPANQIPDHTPASWTPVHTLTRKTPACTPASTTPPCTPASKTPARTPASKTPAHTPVSKTPACTPASKTPACTPACIPGRAVMKQLELSVRSAVQAAKQSLHSSAPPTLLCREEQLHALRDFLHTHLSIRQPAALYVSGAPGTGKSACLHHLLEESEELLSSAKVIVLNCMGLRSAGDVFTRLGAELLAKGRGKGRGTEEALMKCITTSKKMIVVVLDEMDQLGSRGQEVLYSLFEWPALPHSRLLLIGIANALDLTDRLLPRLQSHVSCRPHLLHFPPYSREQIATILTERLGSEVTGSTAVVDPMAVQFCARKVASVHGDLRKALDICRRAIELVETQERCERLRLNSEATPTPAKPIRVTLRHIASVVGEVYGPTLAPSTQHILPLHHKLVVCTLLLLVRGGGRREVTLERLQSAYVRVCHHRQLRCESEGEFVGVCKILETMGILALGRARETRLMKVSLKLQESEVEHALQDKVLLSTILKHGIPQAE